MDAVEEQKEKEELYSPIVKKHKEAMAQAAVGRKVEQESVSLTTSTTSTEQSEEGKYIVFLSFFNLSCRNRVSMILELFVLQAQLICEVPCLEHC